MVIYPFCNGRILEITPTYRIEENISACDVYAKETEYRTYKGLSMQLTQIFGKFSEYTANGKPPPPILFDNEASWELHTGQYKEDNRSFPPRELVSLVPGGSDYNLFYPRGSKDYGRSHGGGYNYSSQIGCGGMVTDVDEVAEKFMQYIFDCNVNSMIFDICDSGNIVPLYSISQLQDKQFFREDLTLYHNRRRSTHRRFMHALLKKKPGIESNNISFSQRVMGAFCKDSHGYLIIYPLIKKLITDK